MMPFVIGLCSYFLRYQLRTLTYASKPRESLSIGWTKAIDGFSIWMEGVEGLS